MASKATLLKEEGNRSDLATLNFRLRLIAYFRYFQKGNFQEAEMLYTRA